MRAESAPAVVDDRTLRAAARPHARRVVRGEEVVEPERVVQRRLALRHQPLLPVKPEAVHAQRLQRLDDVLEIDLRPAFLVAAEWNHALACPAVVLREARIDVLAFRDAAGGVHVERRVQSLVMQEAEHLRRIGEVAAVPRVAAPAPHLPAFGLNDVGTLCDAPVLVPVHFDHAHVHRDADGVHLAHDLAVVRLRVVPEPAPPVAERPPRRQRNASRHLHVVAETSLVVMPIRKYRQIAVRALLANRPFLDPFFPVVAALHEQRLLRIVHHGHTAPREDALLHARQQILDA